MPANFACQLPPSIEARFTKAVEVFGVPKSTVVVRLLTSYLSGELVVKGLPLVQPGQLDAPVKPGKIRRRGMGD